LTRAGATALVPLVLLAACRPSFDETASLVTNERILAVRNDPAEVTPGAAVALTALVASRAGNVSNAQIRWAFCRAPKPLAENDVVSPACFSDGVAPFGGAAPLAMAMVPADACALFGPDAPPQASGQPPERPRDPDATGGYFQPVRADLGGSLTFQLARITCSLANASIDVATEFHRVYKANQNPMLTPLTAMVDGAPVALDQIPAGHQVTFTVGWPADAVERYPVLDVLPQALVMHREAMRVSWFASAGAFDNDSTGRDENDTATSTSNGWLAPKMHTVVHLWTVLHDSRGGTDFAAYTLTLR
jgi:hypothetical protein